ncbi:MAG TPA: S1/P1 nuclease [Steroidobacteraceae bacterium]|jgi:hypothetical protein|nr:S1/P1 nuclease [Steroidobacteraceae bacterium]
MMLLGIAAAAWWATPAAAWGEEGHEVIALVAEHYLTPEVHGRVDALLAGDDSGLCERDIAHEATWADAYRDSDRDGTKLRYYGTREWHYVDLELHSPDLNAACHGRPALPRGTPASSGPADDCIVDKIEQFEAELRDSGTEPRERLLALQFLLHLIGDLHQPLHASDDHDQGGNRERVSAPGIGSGNLHHDWDTEFVARLGAGPADIAERLIARISDEQRRRWSRGTPEDWALESFSAAKTHAYGLLPPRSGKHRYELPESYVLDATQVTAAQLSKAGVRLAFVLNQALR